MAQAPRASFSEPDKIFVENFILFEIRAIRTVVRLVFPGSFITVPDKLVLSEKEGDAPYRRQSHCDIDDPAYDTVASAECPGDKVKTENSHKTPVYAADKQYPERDFIHHCFSPYFLFRIF